MRKLFTFYFLLLFSITLIADNGDTIVIQTIDYNTPVMPGWNAPREGQYLFPSDSMSFSKILMYYTLKCDPGQNPACGEWDYTTHTKVIEHTGVYDSTQYTHPKFKVNNQAPDTFYAMNSPSYKYFPWIEYTNQTEINNEGEIGTDNDNLSFPFGSAEDGRAQFVYTKEELQAAGLNSGELTGLKLKLDNNVYFKHLTIQIRDWNDTLPLDTLITYGFTKVYEKNIQLNSGENQLDFCFPYNWQSTDDILIDISYAESDGLSNLAAYAAGDGEASYSAEADAFLHFSGWDLVEMPAQAFNNIDSAITISFWQYGDPIKQPMNNSIFYGSNADGDRVLNSHLPWSNSQVYWDAGNDGGYDRINHIASNSNKFKGQWNYWLFTKNVHSKTMRMFLNGQLFYPGSGKKKAMNGISEFFIGGAKSNNFYEGYIDDFCVWNEELDFTTIMNTVGMEVDSTHPYYNNLQAYYSFDEGSGNQITDKSPNGYNAIDFFGQAQWMNYKGINRHKHAKRLAYKPFLKLQTGNYDSALLTSIVKVDTMELAANNIIIYDSLNPTQAIDTLLKWPSYYSNYIYDNQGIATDSTLVTPDTTLYNQDYIYYGEPFEILNPWEIARFITPYGNGLSLGDGFTWVYDVTDYAPLLKDSVHIRAGNFQELLDLKFYMIEGTPTREVLNIDKTYSGYWNLKDLEDKVPPKTIHLDPLSEQWKVKTRTTGHLFDNPTNCAEFCAKTHSLSINNNEVKSWEILQECAENPLYPQGGTWIYDRAGWCPGMQVTEQDIEISDYVSADSLIIDYNADYDQYGTYSLEVHTFSYGPFNFDYDLAVTEIRNPNNLKRYGRFNPSYSNPVIMVQNLGAETISSFDINYGPDGSNYTFNYSGSLEPMQTVEITLDAIDWEDWQNGNGIFTASVSNPNGNQDENTINDTYKSNYNEINIYPGTFVIELLTNKAASQNYYEIKNSFGNVIFTKDNLDNETLYRDTLTLFNGIYDFYLYDSGNNGLQFWAEPGQGNGKIAFYDLEGNKIKSFDSDFGANIYHNFYTDIYLNTNETKVSEMGFVLNPVPNDGNFTASWNIENDQELSLEIFDINGKMVYDKNINSSDIGHINISLSGINSGVYTVKLSGNDISAVQKMMVR